MPEPLSSPEPQSTTVMLQNLLDRLATGDETARDALVNLAEKRLMVIAKKLLRNFGGEARIGMWTADVLGEACPRLLRAVDDVKPTSPADFFGLAWQQLHRVLLDRVRKLEGRTNNGDPDGSGDDRKVPRKNENSQGKRKPQEKSNSQLSPQGDGNTPLHEPSGADDSSGTDLMLDLMAAIDRLPDKQAKTAKLKLMGFTHREIAKELGVHHDTVDDYWSKAIVPLSKYLAPYMGTR